MILIIGLYVLADYLQDGLIDGTLWGHHVPVLVLGLNKFTVLNWTRSKNANGQLDLKETMRKVKRKVKNHSHRHAK